MLFGVGETGSDSLAAVLSRELDYNDLPNDTPAYFRQALPDATAFSSRGISRWWGVLAALSTLVAAALAFPHFRESGSWEEEWAASGCDA